VTAELGSDNEAPPRHAHTTTTKPQWKTQRRRRGWAVVPTSKKVCFFYLFLQSGYHLPQQLWLQPPNLSGRARFLGFSTSPGFNLPPQPSTAPEIEHDAQFWGFSTSPGFDFLPRPSTPEIERDARFGAFSTSWALTSLENPRNRARCSFSTSLGSDLP